MLLKFKSYHPDEEKYVWINPMYISSITTHLELTCIGVVGDDDYYVCEPIPDVVKRIDKALEEM